MLRKLVLIAAVFVIAACSLLGIVFYRARQQEKRAAELLQALSTIRVGASTFDEAKAVADRFVDLRPWPVPCSRQNCEYSFVICETALGRLRLARPARFSAHLKVQQGVVAWKSAGLEDGCPPYARIDRWVEAIETTFLTEEPFHARARPDGTGSYTSVVVDLTPAATEDQRRRAFAINVSCLSKIGGCADVHQMLPLITPGEH